jgi:O-antigen/teichoic acid export membrane protein
MSAPRSDARAVVWNTGVQMASKVAVLVMGAVSLAVLTRYLGADDYGKIAVALAYLALFGVLADLGLFTVVVREISRAPERAAELAGTTMTLRVVLGVATVAIAAPISLLMPYDAEVRVAILIAAVPFILALLTHAITAVFQARLRMERTSIAETAGRAAALLASSRSGCRGRWPAGSCACARGSTCARGGACSSPRSRSGSPSRSPRSTSAPTR